MAYFIAYQSRTYEQESAGGYLWAPRHAKNGRHMFHWKNLQKIQPGDYIFSVVKQRIVSVNQAEEAYKEAARPILLELEEPAEKNGWIVRANYQRLQTPIRLTDHMEQLLPMCQEKYGPFTKQGKCNQGYLFEIPDEMGEYLKKATSAKGKNREYIVRNVIDDLEFGEEPEIIRENATPKDLREEAASSPSFLSKLTNMLFRKS